MCNFSLNTDPNHLRLLDFCKLDPLHGSFRKLWEGSGIMWVDLQVHAFSMLLAVGFEAKNRPVELRLIVVVATPTLGTPRVKVTYNVVARTSSRCSVTCMDLEQKKF